MMASLAKRQRSRRRVAARNFLSNISLDGTHRDTGYAVFNKKISCNSIDTSEEVLSDDKRAARDGDENQSVNPGSTYLENSTDSLLDKRQCTSTSPSKRSRACTYSGERLVPNSSRRRLFQGHTLSISEDEPTKLGTDIDLVHHGFQHSARARHKSTSSSTSSVCSSGPKPVPQPQKEVRFLKPGTDNVVLRRERVVLLSGRKVPFAVYSNLPYNRKSQQVSRHEYGDTVRMWHHSGSGEMLLQHQALLATDRSEDAQEVSYGHLLLSHSHYMKNTSVHDDTSGLPAIAESTQSSPGVLYNRQVLISRSLSYDPNYQAKAQYSASISHDRDVEGLAGDLVYDPSLLDDPELRSGKHRTLMTFPSYMTSVIDYVKPSDLKKELNEKFRERFPTLQLTLSKLRSLKKDLMKTAHIKCNVDLWTVAQSYVFFEKIILKGLINKPNRKLVAGACLMLAAKLNDVKGPEITKLIQEIEDCFKLHRKDMLTFELMVLVSLEFSLHTADREIYPHFQRLMYVS